MKPQLGLLGLLCSITAATANLVEVERLSQVPSGWTELGPANAGQTIRLSIALALNNEEAFATKLQQVSDPSNSQYGSHLSRDEALALVRPQQTAIDVTRNWLVSQDVKDSQIQDRGLFLDVFVTVAIAEKLLSTKYNVYEKNGRKTMGAMAYSVPDDVRPHITSIQPTTFFQSTSFYKVEQNVASLGKRANGNAADASTSTNRRQCLGNNTPACLRRLYRMNNRYQEPHPKSLLGIVGFNYQAAQYDQLQKYIDAYAPYANGSSFSVELINNGTNPQGEYPSGEANMDIQIAISMAYTVPVRFYSTGGEDHKFNPDLDISDTTHEYIEPWLQFVAYMLELPDNKLPQVMSISYGVNEQAVPRDYARNICQMFGLLTLRGVSIIVAAGNTGPGISCQSNDGARKTKFLPIFPAACPYVTSVGATEETCPEKAMNFSSGGFSEYWDRPWWQNNAVSSYLGAHGDRFKGYYKATGRAFPDLAAQGTGYPVYNHNRIENGGGTSASAPLFAAMIAVINDSRMKRGKPPLGFLNPWLYNSARHAFRDITRGRSEGCQGDSISGAPAPVIPGGGWDAVAGWDPVTGLGTPLFDILYNLAV